MNSAWHEKSTFLWFECCNHYDMRENLTHISLPHIINRSWQKNIWKQNNWYRTLYESSLTLSSSAMASSNACRAILHASSGFPNTSLPILWKVQKVSPQNSWLCTDNMAIDPHFFVHVFRLSQHRRTQLFPTCAISSVRSTTRTPCLRLETRKNMQKPF